MKAARMDIVEDVIRFEDGEMSDEEVVIFFQKLIDTGLAWQLQGTYGRMAARLIEAGLCTAEDPAEQARGCEAPGCGTECPAITCPRYEGGE